MGAETTNSPIESSMLETQIHEDLSSPIKKLERLLEQENPEQFNPTWLFKKAPGLEKSLRDSSRDQNGDNDWQAVIGLLPAKWQKRWTYLEQPKDRKWSFEEALKALTDLLKEKNPSFFRPKWVRNEYPALCKYIETNLRTPEGKVDWDSLIKGLDTEWQEKWKPDRGTIEDKAKKLEKILVSKNPEQFSPSWIYKNARGISKWAYKNLQSQPEKVDYDKLIKLLNLEWQKRWSYRWQPRVATLDYEATQLKEALSSHEPNYFNTNWIYHRARKVYIYAKRHLRNEEGAIEWKKLIDQLDPELQQKWLYNIRGGNQYGERKIKDIQTIASELEASLSSNNPTYFNPSWVKESLPSIQRWAQRYLKNNDGVIEWQKLIVLLKSEWQGRWSYKESPSTRKSKQIEEKSYIDPAELDRELNKYGDKLYALIAPTGKEDRIIRDSIIDDLLNLIHKGNSDAKVKLNEYLHEIVNEWIDDNPYLAIYKHAPGDLSRVIKRCIYLRDEDRPSIFLSYLYVSLKSEALALPKVSSTDDLYEDGKRRNINERRNA